VAAGLCLSIAQTVATEPVGLQGGDSPIINESSCPTALPEMSKRVSCLDSNEFPDYRFFRFQQKKIRKKILDMPWA
jgi:hypothetical protein